MIGDVGEEGDQGVGISEGIGGGTEGAVDYGTNIAYSPHFSWEDLEIEALKANPQFNPYSPDFEPTMKIGNVVVQGITDVGQANQDAQDALEGMNWGDTQHSDDATFPSMYDPAPPVVEPPVIDPITQPGPTTSYEDSILFNFTPRERHSYLLNQINMGMEPTRGYTGPDGVYVDLTTVYPDIFNPDYVTFPDIGRPSIPPIETTQPMLPMSGGGYVDDYRMNRGGIMDLREPHRYNRGGNVMRNIRDEQARVIGVQDDAADQMNRIRYHSGRDARDERFRVAARERDAREEMGRLRGEARYQGARAFNQGGVASLAPVARNMFRKRRLPRAGMVA